MLWEPLGSFAALKITSCRLPVGDEPEAEKEPQVTEKPQRVRPVPTSRCQIPTKKRHFNRFKPDPSLRQAAQMPGPGSYDPSLSLNVERRSCHAFARSSRKPLHCEQLPSELGPGAYSPRKEAVTAPRVRGCNIAAKPQRFVRQPAQAPPDELTGDQAFWGPLAPTAEGFSDRWFQRLVPDPRQLISHRPQTAPPRRALSTPACGAPPPRPRSAAREDRPGPSPPGHDLESVLVHRRQPRYEAAAIGQGPVAKLAMQAMQDHEVAGQIDVDEMNMQILELQIPRVRVWGFGELESQLERARHTCAVMRQ